MGIINDKIFYLQAEEQNVEELMDHDSNTKEWSWPFTEEVMHSFRDGARAWLKDAIKGVIWAIQPSHWHDMVEGVLYAITHVNETLSAIWDAIVVMYEEEGLPYTAGYIVPEVLTFFVGVGEVKSATEVNKVEKLGEVGKYSDEMADITRIADNVEDLSKAYPDLNIPEGYENYHTGRTEFYNMDEKLAMEEVMSNPENGTAKISELKDPNLPPPSTDWAKMEYVHYADDGTKVTIHYDYNDITGEYLDFKIVYPA